LMRSRKAASSIGVDVVMKCVSRLFTDGSTGGIDAACVTST
jgi:hypothetical protein